MNLQNNQDKPAKSTNELLLMINLKALIAATRSMSRKETVGYYKKYQQKYPNPLQVSKSAVFVLSRWMSYAAILVLIIGISVSLYYLVPMSKDSNLQYTTVITENAQKTKVELADGTVVWLNYGSKISYDSRFGSTNRNVKLTGEAFFAVKKNKELAFKVLTENLQVKVLGTKFNVKAYPAIEQVKVSLNEGSLEVSDSKNELFTYRIKPGEEANYNIKNGKLEINKVNSNKISSWKDGYLYFEKTPLKTVLAEIERKYNIQFIMKDSSINSSLVTATLKNEQLNDVLKSIAYSCKLKYSIQYQKSLDKEMKIYISK